MGGMQTVKPKVADRWKKDGGWSWGGGNKWEARR